VSRTEAPQHSLYFRPLPQGQGSFLLDIAIFATPKRFAHDCHDGSAPAAFDAIANGGAGGITGSGPHGHAGGKLQGISAGVNCKF
jgi:hypothetical protein